MEKSPEPRPVALLQFGYIFEILGGNMISMVPEEGTAQTVVKLTNISVYFLFKSSFKADPEALT